VRRKQEEGEEKRVKRKEEGKGKRKGRKGKGKFSNLEISEK
jgi:hypothetical protein